MSEEKTPKRIQEEMEELKISKFKQKAYSFLGGGLLLLGYAASNLWHMHVFDKHVIKPIEVAANATSVTSDSKEEISMSSALYDARTSTHYSHLENPAIIWKTPYTSVEVLEELLDKSIERAGQIGQLQKAYETGEIDESAPGWVQTAHQNFSAILKEDGVELTAEETTNLEQRLGTFLPALKDLAASEYGQRIASEYEAFNSTIAGGTRTKAKNLKQKHRSLLDTLELAGGWRSIIRFQADDFKDAYAHIFVGYLKANMGYLTEGIDDFKKAKKLMDKYPNEKNLSILRDTPELSQRVIKGLINSSIKELEVLDADPTKFSTGWWKRLRFYNQSIGGQENPSVQDMAEAVNGRYSARMFWSGLLALSLFYMGGRAVKGLRRTREYHVEVA